MTLRSAIAELNPERSLRTPNELRQYFVNRPSSPLQKLKVLLTASADGEYTKVLFTGHRGNGKSTELAKLANELQQENDFLVAHFTVTRTLNLIDMTYADVLLSLTFELIKLAIEHDVDVGESVVEEIYKFTKDITAEVENLEKEHKEIEGSTGGTFGIWFLNFTAKLTGKLQTEQTTRTVVREKVINRISDLIDNSNLIAKKIRDKTGKRVLMIVEDLDKATLERAKHIFYDNAATLASPQVIVIYTFPTALRHDRDYMQITAGFQSYNLPNFKVRNKDGSLFDKGIESLMNVVTNTVEASLFEEGVLEYLVEMSGGIPRELLRLARTACVEAVVEGKNTVDMSAAKNAVREQKNNFQVLLSKEQMSLLAKVKETKEINNNQEYRDLLHNLSVLEYINAQVWYDVNPIVEELLNDTSA